jgi:hypothetical protein
MIVHRTVNLVQGIAAQAWEIQYAPQLEDYPASTNRFQIPIALTYFERYEVSARPGGIGLSVGQVVTRVLYAPIEAEEFGFIVNEVARLQDQFISTFTDKDTYGMVGMYILQKEPARITIQGGDPTFTLTGPSIEHPIGSELWYHGFEMRFRVSGQWPYQC